MNRMTNDSIGPVDGMCVLEAQNIEPLEGRDAGAT